VYNDYAVVLDLVSIVNAHPNILNAMNNVWTTLTDEERVDSDISLNPKYTFNKYWLQFQPLLNIDEAFQMTADTILVWDNYDDTLPEESNVGIENAEKFIAFDDYKLRSIIVTTGGKNKKRSKSKSKKIK
jgi:hypothetical protein